MRTHDEIIAEAQRRHPHNHTVDDPFGETGEAQSDPYGYEETARLAFIAGGAFALEGEPAPAKGDEREALLGALRQGRLNRNEGFLAWSRSEEDEPYPSLTEDEAMADAALAAGFRRPSTPTEEDVERAHLSDCAVHNEPAYPAGPCDCGLIERKAFSDEARQAVADAIDDSAVITPRSEFLGGSTIANVREVADAVLAALSAVHPEVTQ
jgi:hypothetical protein